MQAGCTERLVSFDPPCQVSDDSGPVLSSCLSCQGDEVQLSPQVCQAEGMALVLEGRPRHYEQGPGACHSQAVLFCQQYCYLWLYCDAGQDLLVLLVALPGWCQQRVVCQTQLLV